MVIKLQKQPKRMTYMRLPPTKWTFKFPRIQEWIYEKVQEIQDMGTTDGEGTVLNLFAGQTRLTEIKEYRVDLVAEFEDKGEIHQTYANYVGHAFDFLEFYAEGIKEGKFPPFDIALLDPPFGVRKSREKYNGKWIGSFTKIKNALMDCMSPKGRVITWGYNSVGMSEIRGYEQTEILLVCNNGDHGDIIVVVEDRIV